MWEGMEAPCLLAGDFVSWVNLHLSMNDLLYPALLAPSILAGTVGRESHLAEDVSKEGPNRNAQPSKLFVPLASLSRFSPTVIGTATATTIIHVVTSGSSRASSGRRGHTLDSSNSKASCFRSHSDQLLQDSFYELDLAEGDEGDSSSSPPRLSSSSLASSLSNDETESSKYDLVFETKHRDLPSHKSDASIALPQLFINYCTRAKLYMISPYYSATITGCIDSDLVIGAVFGAVIVNGCERVRISCVCRKLVIINCLECDFSLATLTPTIIIGDCRNLSIGPYNTNYRNLRQHLRLADLSGLLASNLSAVSSVNGVDTTAASHWTALCDVNACLDVSNTNSTAMERTNNGSVFELPVPLSATAVMQVPEKFRVVVVPVKSEHIPLEVTNDRAIMSSGSVLMLYRVCFAKPNPLVIPREYRQQLVAQRQAVEETKLALLNLLRSTQQDGDADSSSVKSSGAMSAGNNETAGKGELDSKLLSSSLLVKKFMEWMVATDNIQEVLDLIKIDSEKGSYHQ
jgi:hypothetical protein